MDKISIAKAVYMKKVVIVGAGPIGLYLAYKLHHAGVKEIVIVDPRAGIYTRPGHVHVTTFSLLKEKINGTFSTDITHGHIKDIERLLYDTIINLPILIEKKEFLRFHDNPRQKGIIVKDAQGKEEVIFCDYAFDCTGTDRKLINTVNTIVSPPLFSVTPITQNVRIKGHMIAYVKITEADINSINATIDPAAPKPEPTIAEHVQSVEKLRAFGWKEFKFPWIYAINFGKGKGCIYTEIPDNLPSQQKEAWLKAVIDANTNSSRVRFEQLPAPRKYPSKPRFITFSVDPQIIDHPAQEAPGLPMVIAAGDSHIEPNFTLGHGIYGGLDRCDRLVQHLTVDDGQILDFAAKSYEKDVQPLLAKHKAAIVENYNTKEEIFDKTLALADKMYVFAIIGAGSSATKELYQKRLVEIKARINYLEANKLWKICFDTTENLQTTNRTPSEIEQSLSQLADKLKLSLTGLPNDYAALRTEATAKLIKTAQQLKEQGTIQFGKGNYAAAITLFKQALSCLQHGALAGKHLHTELTLCSNILICLRKQSNPVAALSFGKNLLQTYPESEDFVPLRQKVLFNLIKANASLLKVAKGAQPPQFYLEAITSLYSENTALLTPAFLVDIAAELELLKQSKVFQNARHPLFATTSNTLYHSTSPNAVGQSYS